MIETRNTCVLSMARLTEATAQRLMTARHEDWPVMGGRLGDCMLIVWAPTDMACHDLPDDLRTVLEWARSCVPSGESPADSAGFEYVIFDQDVAPEEDGCTLPLPAWNPMAAQPGEFVVLHDEAVGYDSNDQERTIKSGEVWKVQDSRYLTSGQGHCITLQHHSGVFCVLDESDPEPRFNFTRAALPVFSVNVRAMRHLTATVFVEAVDEGSARSAADKMARKIDFAWDESAAEDVQIEGFN